MSGSEDSSEQAAPLVERLQQGDPSALGPLFSLFRERLWRIVYFRLDRRLAGRIDADDILQEAYLNASQRIEHFLSKPDMPAFLWLRLVVNQTLIDLHRRHLGTQRRDAQRERSLSPAISDSTSMSLAAHLAADLTSPSNAAVRDETAGQLEQALESMNEIDREVLALRHFEELTNGETAAVLEISEKAASNRYTRALLRLREIMNQFSAT